MFFDFSLRLPWYPLSGRSGLRFAVRAGNLDGGAPDEGGSVEVGGSPRKRGGAARCVALLPSGRRCGRWASVGYDRCSSHRPEDDNRMSCSGFNVDGSPCRRPATTGGFYCYRHDLERAASAARPASLADAFRRDATERKRAPARCRHCGAQGPATLRQDGGFARCRICGRSR